ncbi:RNA polymerase sigma factor, sigma-70 family [Singulisphaera sp. GP187]|uniref:sigma-70 family RNA polymerase sigma factor n=1 Tax=Singulisphaera sp. GP187 TaxID=1882752 RepID=UPI000927412D|nr:sigma-70 family RNA polymerase sigma factor [Singulisphaera sp. GP187]SIO59900.1 RNA polymerase sigma factor, sigma-70 family [Singulisphaera sp. GP187]
MTPGDLDLRLREQIRTLFEVGSLGALSDRQLLDRFSSGDTAASEPAFAMLVERHGPLVLAVCRRLLADPHLAEDAFQATFLVLARRAGSVRNRDALGGWLHRVARRVALRLRIRIDRRKSHERPEVEEVAVNDADRLQHDELRAVIDAEIDRLGEAQRLPVVLCCLQGLSHEEAAHQLDWPLGSVKSRLARGRRRLQDRLLRRGFAPAVAAVAGSTAFLGNEATAAVAPALVEATARAATALAIRGLVTGVVPATALVLVREELVSMIAFKLKLAAAVSLTAGSFALLIGFALAASQGEEASPKIAPAKQAAETPSANKADASPVVVKLSASGKVVDSGGKPIAGATVILREWSLYRAREPRSKEDRTFMEREGLVDSLAETKTDDEGRFRFDDVAAPGFKKTEGVGQSVFPWDVVALAPGHGLNWVQLTLQNQQAPITLTLGLEGTVRGRIVEPGGKPVVDAKVSVYGLQPLGSPDINGVRTDNGLNLSWSAFPVGAKTDSEGRFIIRGLPIERIAALAVTEPRHERLFAFAATTDEPQPNHIQRSFRSFGRVTESRHPIHTGGFTLTAKTTDHVLTGRVTLETGGKPARDARLTCNNQATKADSAGRFHIEGLTSGPLELQVTSADVDAAPIVTTIAIPEEPKVLERSLSLPPGLVLTGRVLDGASGKGIANALLTFIPMPEAARTSLDFDPQNETDAEGRYRLVVPAGLGTLLLQTIPQGFAKPVGDRFDGPADPKFSREISGRSGQTIEVAEFSLIRSRNIVLRVVDPDGRPVENARVDVRDFNRQPEQPSGKTDTQGRYEVTGLQPHEGTVIDVTASDRRLGAMIELLDDETATTAATSLEVRLQPLGTLSGHVLDDDGKPLAVQVLYLYRSVAFPDQSGRSFGRIVATQHQIDEDGSYSFDQIIAGASYNTHVEVSGHATSSGKHATVKPGQSVRLDDFRLPVTDQEVKGVVVDPRGNPLDKVMVSYDRSNRTDAIMPPTGSVWFEKTKSFGRFHLTGLPRGPIKLSVSRSQEGADRSIRNIKSIDVADDQHELLRIELPDANDHLRGID